MTGAVSLIIFICCVVLFIIDKIPMATAAILGCVLMVITGASDFSTAFGEFSSSTVILTIGVMVIGAAVSETGLSKIVGSKIVKSAKGSEIKLITFTYLTSSFLSAFLTNSAVLAIFIPIIMAATKSNSSLRCKELIMPITLGCILGGASTLAGSTQQLVTQGMLEASNEKTFGMFDLTPLGVVLILLGLLYCLTIGRYIGKRIWNEDNYKEAGDEALIATLKCDKRKICYVSIIFAFAVVSYITEWIPLAVTSTIAALACVISGCITQKRAIQSIDWNIIGRFGGYLGMAKSLEVSGGSKLIADFFEKIFGGSLSPVALLAVAIIVTKLISEVMSPSAALLIVLPFVFSVVEKYGLNTYAYALAVTFASSTALATPLASTTLGMSMSVGYRFNDYFKYYILFDLISFFVIFAFVIGAYGLTV